jgi:ribosome biogenesis GTPase
MIAANIDAAFIVQSCHYDFNLNRLDRYLVVVNEGNIEPIVVLSKTDLVAPDELNGLTTEIVANGITAPLLPISNATGAGLDMLRERLVPGQTYCLLGSSGVGKTTLINRLVGEEAFDTKAVSDSGEGVHTTSRRQLIMLDNGAMLIDTPGMRELGLLGTEDGIDNSFSEISDIAPMCRFANCTHMTEPGCAVLAAVESGDVTEERYESFLKLRRESAFHDMSYVEKRQKDKDLGKFYRSVMRDKKKYKDK